MPTPLDHILDAEFTKPPFSTKKSLKKPAPEKWEFETPPTFPEDASAILKRNRISRKKFNRFTEELALFLIKNGSADFAISMQQGLRGGHFKTMEMFAKMAGLVKNDAATVINLNQNLALTQNIGQERRFDSIVRQLDERDRKSRLEPVITVEAIESGEPADGSLEAR